MHKPVDGRLELLELAPHFGQLGQGGLFDHLFAFGGGGNADHASPFGDIVDHAGHRPQHGLGADMHVIAHADLSGHDDVVAGGRAPGNPDLGAEEIVLSDVAVVGDHHLVVDLGPFADDRRAVGAAVDGRIGANFHVFAEDHVAQLGGQPMAAFVKAITKPIADHGPGMNDASRADDRVLVDHRVRINGDLRPDLHAGHDVDARMDRRPSPISTSSPIVQNG